MAETHLLKGEPPVEVELRRNARARRLTLRVASRDGRVTLTVPRGVSDRAALDFAQSKQDWLARHMAKLPAAAPLKLGDILPIEGQDVRLETERIRAPKREGDRLLVPTRYAERPGRAAAAFLKLLARERLAEASDAYSEALGRPYHRMTLRDPRTRWGSCSSAGALMYSWRLAMAPPDVLRYVAAHEVAHLQEMNHSPDFWAVVGRLMPDYARHRDWIKREGAVLQRIVLD